MFSDLPPLVEHHATTCVWAGAWRALGAEAFAVPHRGWPGHLTANGGDVDLPPQEVKQRARVVAAFLGPDPSGQESKNTYLEAVAEGAVGVVLGGPTAHPTAGLNRAANEAGWTFTNSTIDTAKCGEPFNQTRWVWCAVKSGPPPPPVPETLCGVQGSQPGCAGPSPLRPVAGPYLTRASQVLVYAWEEGWGLVRDTEVTGSRRGPLRHGWWIPEGVGGGLPVYNRGGPSAHSKGWSG